MPSRLVIKNGRVIDPASNRDGSFDVVIEGEKVTDIVKPGGKFTDATVIDAAGCIVAPGFIDLHTHLREPGYEYKETIESGTASAAAGGFTSICCMANTDPVNDHAAITDFITKKAREVGLVNVFPIGALTKGLKGEEIAPMGELKEAGCVAFSDDGRTVAKPSVMRTCMEYAKTFGLPVIVHAIDECLAGAGVMHEGFVSLKTGLKGIPREAEEIVIARDILVARLTGASLHIAHISTEGGVDLVRQAKKRGLPVTAEVTPHHLALTDEALADYNTNAKMMPPLRSEGDRKALIQALSEGVIDAIATDHAPHAIVDKEVEFDRAAFGVIGFETALQIILQLVDNKELSIIDMIHRLTVNPARIAGINRGCLSKGAIADVVIFDPKAPVVIDPTKFLSKGRNTPFAGMKLKGQVKKTVVGGKIVYSGEREA